MKSFVIFISLLLTMSSVYANVYVSDREFNNAIKSGNIEFVKANMSKVKNINSDICFLCTAIEKKQNDILDVLLEKCDPNSPESALLPLYGALVSKNNYAVDKLLAAGADPNIDTHFAPMLIFAIIDGNAHAVTKLLEAGADANVTFFKLSAIQYAFLSDKNSYDIEDAFINFWNKKYEKPPTDINKALELLKNSKAGNKYYSNLMGNNSTNKPFRIVYCELGNINPDIAKYSFFNIYNSSTKQSTIYINNKYRNASPEVIATLLAGASINTDGKSSVVEDLVSYGVIANVWREFATNNPKLTTEQNFFVQGYNGILKIMDLEGGNMFKKGDYNNLWSLSGLLRGKNQTSPQQGLE